MYLDIYLKKFLNILLYTSHSMSIGLIPFLILFSYNLLYYSLSFELLIPLIVFINGVLYHSFFQDNRIIILYDTFTNIILISYLMYISNCHSDSIIAIIYAIIMFFTAIYYNSYFIHIIGVQLIFINLYINESKNFLIP